MKTLKQPTKPGPYWWRAKEGDEWEVWEVIIWRLPGEIGDRNPKAMRYGYTPKEVRSLGGEWLPIPRPNEMQKAWVVRDVETSEVIAASSISARGAIMKAWHVLGDPRETNQCPGGYTYKPVLIAPLEVEDE